jgi:hypothetical protein
MTSKAGPETPARIVPGSSPRLRAAWVAATFAPATAWLYRRPGVSADSTGAARPGLAEDVSRQGQAQLRHRARNQVMGLTAQFLLGMAVNLLGLPSEATGASRVASTVFLAMHVLIALGLIIVAILTVRAATHASSQTRNQAIWGATAIAATVTAGILATITKSNWWSYAMALGFIASLLTYGSLLLKPAAPPAPK